ncbi:unnamed protein product, partial [Prorocentrum cordatum]
SGPSPPRGPPRAPPPLPRGRRPGAEPLWWRRGARRPAMNPVALAAVGLRRELREEHLLQGDGDTTPSARGAVDEDSLAPSSAGAADGPAPRPGAAWPPACADLLEGLCGICRGPGAASAAGQPVEPEECEGEALGGLHLQFLPGAGPESVADRLPAWQSHLEPAGASRPAAADAARRLTWTRASAGSALGSPAAAWGWEARSSSAATRHWPASCLLQCTKG